jgi:hypothetical protein
MQRRIRTLSFLLVVVFASISAATARADEVTDWNQILFQAALVAKTSQLFATCNAVICTGLDVDWCVATLDAIDGVEDRRLEGRFVS